MSPQSARHATRTGATRRGHTVPRHADRPATSQSALGTARTAGRATGAAGVPLLLAAVVTAGAPGWGPYTVKPGDTLGDIAERRDTTVADLVLRNSLPDGGGRIVAGRSLQVPAGSQSDAGGEPAPAGTYTVAPGDSLSVIASRASTSVGALRAANGLTGDLIRSGDVLRLPSAGESGGPAEAPEASSGRRHTVAAGENVSVIALSYGVSVRSVVDTNGLGADALIRAGQVLTVPGAAVSPGSAPAASTAAPIPSGGNTFAGRTYSDAVVGSADGNRAELASREVPSREEMRAIITRTSQTYGVDPSIALAISYQESGFNQQRVSVANAVGAMQVIPATGEWMSSVAGRNLDLLDPEDNALAGVLLLRELTSTAATQDQAIAGYYQGLRSVRERGMYADTKVYVANVQALRGRFRNG